MDKCPSCEYNKLRAANWRAEAYRLAGHDVIEPPPECQTEAEKTAFAFGWFKAMEAQRKLVGGMALNQQRTWVGLTDVERRQAVNAVTYSQLAMTHAEWVHEVQKETERRLKEKNT